MKMKGFDFEIFYKCIIFVLFCELCYAQEYEFCLKLNHLQIGEFNETTITQAESAYLCKLSTGFTNYNLLRTSTDNLSFIDVFGGGQVEIDMMYSWFVSFIVWDLIGGQITNRRTYNGIFNSMEDNQKFYLTVHPHPLTEVFLTVPKMEISLFINTGFTAPGELVNPPNMYVYEDTLKNDGTKIFTFRGILTNYLNFGQIRLPYLVVPKNEFYIINDMLDSKLTLSPAKGNYANYIVKFNNNDDVMTFYNSIFPNAI